MRDNLYFIKDKPQKNDARMATEAKQHKTTNNKTILRGEKMTNELLNMIKEFQTKKRQYIRAATERDKKLYNISMEYDELWQQLRNKEITPEEYKNKEADIQKKSTVYSKYEYMKKNEFILRIMYDNIRCKVQEEATEVIVTVLNKYKGKQMGKKTEEAIKNEVENNFIYNDDAIYNSGNIFYMYFDRDYMSNKCDLIILRLYITLPDGDAREQKNDNTLYIQTKWETGACQRTKMIDGCNTIQDISIDDFIKNNECIIEEPAAYYQQFTKATKHYYKCLKALEEATEAWNELRPTSYKYKSIRIEE